MAQSDSEPGKRVVAILRFSALGDVAMALPVVYSAAMSNRDIDFLFVTRPPFDRLAVNTPANLSVVALDFSKFKGINPMWGVVRLLRKKYGVTEIVDIHDVLRTKLIRMTSALFGIRSAVIDKGRRDKRALTRPANKIVKPLQTTVDRYRETFRRAAIDPGDCFDSLFPGKKASPSMFGNVTEPRRNGEIWVGIAPFAKHAGKIYPVDKMEHVVDMLASDSRIKLFFFGGGGDEAATLSRWADRHSGRAVSLAGRRLGFPVELALMSNLDVMVSMDSGNMHMASLVRTPVVSIWGATHPFCGFTGWRQSEMNIVQTEMPCRPCSVFGNRPCLTGDYRCMTSITPEMIARRVMKVIDKKFDREGQNNQ